MSQTINIFNWFVSLLDSNLVVLFILGISILLSSIVMISYLKNHLAERIICRLSAKSDFIHNLYSSHTLIFQWVINSSYYFGFLLTCLYMYLRFGILYMVVTLIFLLIPIVLLKGNIIKSLINNQIHYLRTNYSVGSNLELLRYSSYFDLYLQNLFARFEPPLESLPKGVLKNWMTQKQLLLKREDEIGERFQLELVKWLNIPIDERPVLEDSMISEIYYELDNSSSLSGFRIDMLLKDNRLESIIKKMAKENHPNKLIDQYLWQWFNRFESLHEKQGFEKPKRKFIRMYEQMKEKFLHGQDPADILFQNSLERWQNSQT